MAIWTSSAGLSSRAMPPPSADESSDPRTSCSRHGGASALTVVGGRSVWSDKDLRFGDSVRIKSASTFAEGIFDDTKKLIEFTHHKVAEETLTTTTVVKAGVKGVVVGGGPQLNVKSDPGVDYVEEPVGERRAPDPARKRDRIRGRQRRRPRSRNRDRARRVSALRHQSQAACRGRRSEVRQELRTPFLPAWPDRAAAPDSRGRLHHRNDREENLVERHADAWCENR